MEWTDIKMDCRIKEGDLPAITEVIQKAKGIPFSHPNLRIRERTLGVLGGSMRGDALQNIEYQVFEDYHSGQTSLRLYSVEGGEFIQKP